MLRHTVAVAAVALSLFVAGCDDDDEPTGPSSAAGTYQIATIEQTGFAECTLGATGCTLNDTGTDVVVLESGVLTLEEDGDFTLVASGTLNDVDEELVSASGTWVRTSTGVTLNVTGIGVPLTGTFSSSAEDELVFVVPGSVLTTTSTTITVTFDRRRGQGGQGVRGQGVRGQGVRGQGVRGQGGQGSRESGVRKSGKGTRDQVPGLVSVVRSSTSQHRGVDGSPVRLRRALILSSSPLVPRSLVPFPLFLTPDP